MKKYRLHACAVLVAFVCVAIVAALSDLPHFSAVGILFFPGMILAGVMFPQGIHSGWGGTYLVVAGLIDWVLFAVLLIWFFKLLERRRFGG